MPNIKDFLPPPPWEGPPIPRWLLAKYIPRVERGLSEEVARAEKALWDAALQKTLAEYPTGDPRIVAEARLANISPLEVQLIIAHELYKERRKALGRRWAAEAQAEDRAMNQDEGDEDEEEEEK